MIDKAVRDGDVLDKTDEIITEVNNHETKIMNLLTWMGLVKDYVIEAGQNANGQWEKWNSGKLVQWGDATGTPNTDTLKTFPITFSSEPFLLGVVSRAGGYNNLCVQLKRNGNGSMVAYTWSTAGSPPPSIQVNWMAIGRWK